MESVATETITFDESGLGADPAQHDVAIVVIGETPYAEFEGDREDLALDTVDQATIANVQASGLPIVLVVISGRPMIMTEEIDSVDAVVAAWLPGTEGDGLAEVLFGDYDFQGKLSFSWPANMAQITSGFVGDNPNVLYPFGFGLNYGNNTQVATAAPSALPTAVESDAPTSAKVLQLLLRQCLQRLWSVQILQQARQQLCLLYHQLNLMSQLFRLQVQPQYHRDSLWILEYPHSLGLWCLKN